MRQSHSPRLRFRRVYLSLILIIWSFTSSSSNSSSTLDNTIDTATTVPHPNPPPPTIDETSNNKKIIPIDIPLTITIGPIVSNHNNDNISSKNNDNSIIDYKNATTTVTAISPRDISDIKTLLSWKLRQLLSRQSLSSSSSNDNNHNNDREENDDGSSSGSGKKEVVVSTKNRNKKWTMINNNNMTFIISMVQLHERDLVMTGYFLCFVSIFSYGTDNHHQESSSSSHGDDVDSNDINIMVNNARHDIRHSLKEGWHASFSEEEDLLHLIRSAREGRRHHDGNNSDGNAMDHLRYATITWNDDDSKDGDSIIATITTTTTKKINATKTMIILGIAACALALCLWTLIPYFQSVNNDNNPNEHKKDDIRDIPDSRNVLRRTSMFVRIMEFDWLMANVRDEIKRFVMVSSSSSSSSVCHNSCPDNDHNDDEDEKEEEGISLPSLQHHPHRPLSSSSSSSSSPTFLLVDNHLPSPPSVSSSDRHPSPLFLHDDNDSESSSSHHQEQRRELSLPNDNSNNNDSHFIINRHYRHIRCSNSDVVISSFSLPEDTTTPLPTSTTKTTTSAATTTTTRMKPLSSFVERSIERLFSKVKLFFMRDLLFHSNKTLQVGESQSVVSGDFSNQT